MTNAEAFPARVLRDMFDAVLVLDHQGQLVYFNEPAALMLELDEDEQKAREAS